MGLQLKFKINWITNKTIAGIFDLFELFLNIIINDVNIKIYKIGQTIEKASDGGVKAGLFNVLYQAFIIVFFIWFINFSLAV